MPSLRSIPLFARAAVALVPLLAGASAPKVSDAQFQHDSEYYLASDALEGRGPGSRGQQLAGAYVADQFRKAGLTPVPGHDFFQPFEYVTGMKVGSATALTLGGGALTLDTDFRPTAISAPRAFDGPVTFAGYGISSTRYKYDDYAGHDVKGRTVLICRYDPRDAAGHSRFTHGEEWSTEASLVRKMLVAQNHGASAVILVNPPGMPNADALSPFTGTGRTATRCRWSRSHRPPSTAPWPPMDNLRSPSWCNSIDASGTPATRDLPGLDAHLNVELQRSSVWVRNVIGELQGHGPLANEFIVVGAHYDHVGHGGPSSGSLAPNVNAIHHGADDNASGTTAVMTLARRLGTMKDRQGRSILFMAFVNEEEGLIGSHYWTEHPTIPLKDIAYMLNLDMLGRMKNHTLIHGGEGTSKAFDAMLARAYEGEGLTKKSMGAGGYGPSDHESFARKRIPVLFLFTGLHRDYHRPTDTADKINYPGLLASTDVAERIVDQMLVAPRTPYDRSHDEDPVDLGEADAFPSPALHDIASPPPAPTRAAIGLGLIPDMTTRDRGMAVDGVRQGMGAAKAGIAEGDVVLELDGTPINSVNDLQAVYDRHKPGDTVKIRFQRGTQTLDRDVTFSARGQQ